MCSFSSERVHVTCLLISAVTSTNIKCLWRFLGEQIKHLFSVGDSVGNSQIFVPAAQLCTDVIQSNSLVTIALKSKTKTSL